MNTFEGHLFVGRMHPLSANLPYVMHVARNEISFSRHPYMDCMVCTSRLVERAAARPFLRTEFSLRYPRRVWFLRRGVVFDCNNVADERHRLYIGFNLFLSTSKNNFFAKLDEHGWKD